MQIKRFSEQCIICLAAPPFAAGNSWSTEHVIPKAIGGILTCTFLCKSCNEKMGSGLEKLAKSDPSIRVAIGSLSSELPNLYASIEDGQEHILNTPVGQIVGKYRDGEIQGGYGKLSDGSLLVPSNDAARHIQNKLAKEGLTHIQVQDALDILGKAEIGVAADPSPNIAAVEHTADYIGPNLSAGEPLNPLVALKIAYEFAALIAGSPILESRFPFADIRRSLMGQSSGMDSFSFEKFEANKYKPFHGIAFEGNLPVASFQIRLFGKIAYRIKFAKIALDLEPCKYTHDLKSGKDTFSISKRHAAK